MELRPLLTLASPLTVCDVEILSARAGYEMMSENLERPRPIGWRESPLFSFIEDCWGNSIAAVGTRGLLTQHLTEIDRVFENIFQQGLKPLTTTELIPCFLFIRSMTAFRASVMVSTCLHTDGYAPLRSCLETAGYACLIATEPSYIKLWLTRDASSENKKKVRATFTHSAISKAMAAHDQQLSTIYSELYERTIDWGAHPNEKSLSANFVKDTVHRDTQNIQFKLLPGGGASLDLVLKSVAQGGLCVLKIFSYLIPSAFDSDARKQLLDLSSGL